MPEGWRNRLKIRQIRLQKRYILLDNRIENPRQIKHLQRDIIVYLSPLVFLCNTRLSNLEVDVEILNLRERIDDLLEARLRFIVVRHWELICLVFPSFTGFLFAVEVDLCKRLLPVVDDISSIDVQ